MLPIFFRWSMGPAWERRMEHDSCSLKSLQSWKKHPLLGFFFSHEAFLGQDSFLIDAYTSGQLESLAVRLTVVGDFRGYTGIVPWSSSLGHVVTPSLHSGLPLLFHLLMARSTREMCWQAEASIQGPKWKKSGTLKWIHVSIHCPEQCVQRKAWNCCWWLVAQSLPSGQSSLVSQRGWGEMMPIPHRPMLLPHSLHSPWVSFCGNQPPRWPSIFPAFWYSCYFVIFSNIK